MENNRPKLVSLSSRLSEPIALCDTAKVIFKDEDESGDVNDDQAMIGIMLMMMMRTIRGNLPV